MIHGGEIYDKKVDIDFSVSLNPCPFPEEIWNAVQSAAGTINRYPDREQRQFREKVAMAENRLLKKNFLTAENVLGGNGASELIMAITRLLSPKKVLLPVPCFYGYFHAVSALKEVHIKEYQISSEKDFALGEDFLNMIDKSTDLVIIGNPNNPTGRLIDEELLEKIVMRCKKMGTALLVDECFLRLSRGGTSAAKFIGSCKNLFVVNAYTKLFSIPGVRVGYTLASKENIEALKALLPEWNMSVFALEAGEACAEVLATGDYIEESLGYIEPIRRRMEHDLKELGLIVYPSDTNFILVYSVKNLYDSFLDRGILIRDCSNFRGLDKGFYRIAVKDEMSYERMKQCFSFLT